MQSIKRIRRNQSQWQQIIRDWQTSRLTARQFCAEHKLAYASFSNWRRKLSGAKEGQSDNEDLFQLLPANESAPVGWNITLKLGGDIELVLSR